MSGLDLAVDKARAFALTPVSETVREMLEKYIDLLLLWQQTTNLISPATIPHLWTRHVADSLQLLDLAPVEVKVWVDFGSGGGFPAIPVACVLADRGGHVDLVESNGKKAAFLREAIRVTGAPATVYVERAEDYGDRSGDNVTVVSARALAPLHILLEQAYPLLTRGALALFPKGQDVDVELTTAAKYWMLQADKRPSKTSPDGCVVVVRGLQRR